MLLRTLRRTSVWMILGSVSVLFVAGSTLSASGVVISSPMEGAVFPRDFAPALFRWRDESSAVRWELRITPAEGAAVTAACTGREWRPSAQAWEVIKRASLDRRTTLTVTGISSAGEAVSSGLVSFRTSPDPVGAPIFYREVPLPVGFAMDNKPMISWKLGDVSSETPPRTVLSGMRTCANCHSFSADGKTLAMDIDFGPDKSTYAITEISKEVTVSRSDLIAWNDYQREEGKGTLGLLSSISPGGRHVVSTVKETIVLRFMPDPYCSQLFFPIRGILAVYDRVSRSFRSLRGADDPSFVQTNPASSPDGKWLVFARARVPEFPREAIEAGPEAGQEYEDGRRRICYDLYRVPFNEGAGGKAEPLSGAAGNEKSNFFARYSPDGRWIVFCQAGSMMLNRPDSALYVMPAAGGTPRRLRCNAPGRMNSWHSFSPNGRWLVYASKASGPMTQLWLTHIDFNGEDTPPVMLDGWVAPDRAANLPEFVSLAPGQLQSIRIAEEIRGSTPKLPRRPE